MLSEQVEKLMVEIKQTWAKMQEKVGKLQEEVTTNQDNAAQKIVKKLKADRQYTLWKIGHEQ